MIVGQARGLRGALGPAVATMSSFPVVIRGDGVAAYCCAHLLHKAAFRVSLDPVDRPRLPAIMLGEQALALIRDVFERPDLFTDLPRISKRVVAWGPDAQPLTVEHSAVVVSEDVLLDAIRPPLPPADAGRWTIFAARPLPRPTSENRFGSRLAHIAPVKLHEHAEPGVCWIESLADGWLFLIPQTPASGWLLAIGAAPEFLVGQSKVVAAQIREIGSPMAEVPAYARIAEPLGGPDWLACGTAAMTFDPICGDGTAQAIREAILAAAVIRALANGGDAGGLLAHYEARLTAGFRRHLQLCLGYYQSGGTTPLWRAEFEAIDCGIQWCDARLATHMAFRYRLRGFELEAVT
jgi:hypothetical protein